MPSETDENSATPIGLPADHAGGLPMADSPAPSSSDAVDMPTGETLTEPAAAELPKKLQAFGQMLQYEIQPQFSDAMEILSEAPVTAEDLGLTSSTEAVEMPAIDLRSQSQIVIPALVIGQLPLSQFASLWSNLSGIPTVVDLDSLTAAGIDRNQSIGLSMVKSASVGSLIVQIGTPLGLQGVPRDNRFLELAAPTAAMQEHLPPDISLAGLVDGAQEAWLLETLSQLFPELVTDLTEDSQLEFAEEPELLGEADVSVELPAPESPQPSDEGSEAADELTFSEEPVPVDDSAAPQQPAPAASDDLQAQLPHTAPGEAIVWKIEQGKLLLPQTASGGTVDLRIWSAAVHLLEGWRHAAGLPTTWPGFDPQRHSSRLVAPADIEELDFVLQQVQAEARPMAQIIPSICREAGLQAWVDWPNLAGIGLGPQTTALVLTNSRPLRRALADYASRFSLVVAVLDEQSLWITSNQAYRSSPRLYVIPSQDLTAEAWVSRLRPLTPAAADGVEVGQVVAVATPDAKFMLVRCCPMQVDFQQ